MLRIEEIRPKSYEERMTEAIAQIPLYSDEWTNFNVSDPGITILENLTAFTALQADSLSDIPFDAKRRLFALAGFRPAKGRPARVLIKAGGSTADRMLPANSRFYLGGMVFEANRPVQLGGHLIGVFSCIDGQFKDLSFLTERDIPVAAEVFGPEPKEGDALYFVTNILPEDMKELICFITMTEGIVRNPLEDRAENVFAGLRWECFTEAGFVEIKARDFTGCFLTDGEIRLRMPDQKPVVCEEAPTKGYCIRAVLTHAAYDVPPRVSAIESFLFEVWQKDTLAGNVTFGRTERMQVCHPLAGYEHILVFAKEEKGSSYRRYELSYTGDEPGRICKYTPGERDQNGRQKNFTIAFGGNGSAYRPAEKVKDPVRVILYNDDIMRQYSIGTVLGYDDQEMDLPVKYIVQDSFCLIARRRDAEGAFLYDFVRPEKQGENTLYYHLLENDGKIIIADAGAYIGADLFVGTVAVTEGEKGNVRAMSRFTCEQNVPGVKWFNPGAGTGGAYRETLAQLGARFRRDIDTPYTAVTAADYERIVMETPGLCIRKAHAVIDEVENLVRIAVLPGTGEDYPALSNIYQDVIREHLEDRRLLTTRIEILPPQYVPIHVRGTVYVKRHYNDPRSEIEQTIRDELDDVRSDRHFGEVLEFNRLFRTIEALPCVSFLYELTVLPEDRQLARVEDSDIYPRADTLCMAGEILLEIVTDEQ
ncbi:MAG: baseplate J/gp47 family protein [Lachnospiraceae bacterium]|nr:baseplate J/gp47 family protein [Lachnospiraceae bacterium]